MIYDTNYSPALVIGGGKVGRAAVRELRRRQFPVHVVEKDEASARALESEADLVVVGDAADREVLLRAGLGEAPVRPRRPCLPFLGLPFWLDTSVSRVGNWL